MKSNSNSNSPFTPMDSQNSSAPPSHHVPPPPSHPAAALLSPHSQSQHHQPNTSYPLATSSNAVNPSTTSATIMHPQNPGFSFNAMTGPKPADHLQPDVPARKKRGRPRKYSPGNSIGLGLSPAPVSQTPPVMARNDSGGGTPSSETSSKRNRGRPPSSVKIQLDALGVSGVGFTPHVISVNAGEDIASKILAFSRQGPRNVCVISANGAVSNATLRQVAMSGGTVTYEGRFEIISLSGSFLLSESSGNRSRIGSLSISLAGPEHKVLGGGVAGMLTAASPVQVIIGSFLAEGKKSKSGPSSNTPETGTGTSPSPGGSSEPGKEKDDSPLNHGPGSYGNTGRPGQTMPMYNSMAWQTA